MTFTVRLYFWLAKMVKDKDRSPEVMVLKIELSKLAKALLLPHGRPKN